MVPFHAQKRKGAFHEPPRFGLRRQSAAATALCRGCAVPSESKRGRASLAPAVQKAVTPLFYLTGSWSHFMRKRERRLSMNLRDLDCAGRAQRRGRFAEGAPYRVSQSGVALRLPPQSKSRSRHYSTLQVHGPISCAKAKGASRFRGSMRKSFGKVS